MQANAGGARAFHELLPDAGNSEEDGGAHRQEALFERAELQVQRPREVGGGVAGFDGGADERGDDINHHASDVRQRQV
jgi:hypothetical protein